MHGVPRKLSKDPIGVLFGATVRRLRERPRVAITILAAENVAFTARGPARVVQEPMSTAPDYAAIAIDVEQIDDHRQPAFQVQAGVDRHWRDETERRPRTARPIAHRAGGKLTAGVRRSNRRIRS